MSATAGALSSLPGDIQVLERGWLSSNNILLGGDERGAVLVDTGYASHVPQTLALVRQALGAQPLRLVINTHLHSDHCGGNAALVTEHGCPLLIPPGLYDAVQAWDRSALSFDGTGQRCEPFRADGRLLPGQVLEQGGRDWEIHAAPGHDPDAVLLFEPRDGILISADAFWERGFGIVFPEVEDVPSQGFDEVQATLDLIERLAPRIVIPGHGQVFTDVMRAMAIARERLDYFRRNPASHAKYASKALTMFHMLELLRCPRQDLLDWLATMEIQQRVWARHFQSRGNFPDWNAQILDELVAAGTLISLASTGDIAVPRQ